MAVGVLVNTATTPAGSGDDATASAAFFLAGITERGDVNAPVLVRSMSEAEDVLGLRVTYGAVYDQLATFFGEGGSRAYVARVVGPAATVGSRTLADSSAVATLRVDAKDPGAWASNVTVEVAAGLIANTFTLIVRYKGAVVETFSNLTDPAAAVAATSTSGYVRLTNLGSATAAPGNNPAVAAAAALTTVTGTDDRASVVASTYVTALARFTAEYGAGVVAIPGQTYSAVATGLATHAQTFNRIALVAPAVGQSVSAASAAARGLRTSANAEFLGFVYPWVQISDGASSIRTISPEGFVAGLRARLIAERGTVGNAPAGAAGIGRYVIGVEKNLTKDEVNSLSDDAVSPIRAFGSGVRLYGWRSLSTDEANYRFLNAREVMNDLAVRGEKELERFVFRTIDGRGHLFAEVSAALSAIVDPMRVAGVIYEKTATDGSRVDLGYSIDTGPSVNTPPTIQAGQVKAQLKVRVSPVGELIQLTITKVALRAEL